MTNTTVADEHTRPQVDQTASWGTVYAMTLCSFILVACEFMPISLLTPIASDLGLTQGQAGQAISVSGLSAMLASLLVGRVAGIADRRTVLLSLTVMLVASSLLVPMSSTYSMFMVGRVVLGVAIGGFWGMSAAIAMRLVPPTSVPRALAVMNGGNALAAVIAAPAGAFIGGHLGWRGSFYCAVPLAVLALIWLAISLPSLPYRRPVAGKGFLVLLGSKPVLIGYGASALLYMGQYSLFTYLRPFLEQVTLVDVNSISGLLLLTGVAGFVGTTLIGRFIGRRLHLLLAVLPAILSMLAVGLALFGQSLVIVAALLAAWGLVATAANVPWWTWVTRAAADDPEAGGGLIVAIVQLSIMIGAGVGGLIYDDFGPTSQFLCSAALLALASYVALKSKIGSEHGTRKKTSGEGP